MAEVEIHIDLSQYSDSSLESFANSVLDSAADVARSEWITLAQQRFKTTAADYINGIQEIESEGLERTIRLEGTLPNMLEQGADAFDIKPGELASPKAKTSKDGGKYITIGMEKGSPTQNLIPKLPEDIFNRAKGMKYGETLRDFNKRKSWKGYEHKTGIYDNLKRNYPQTTQNNRHSFSTFRTISSKSDPSSWFHPGFKAANLTEQAKDSVEAQLDSIVRDQATQLGL